MSERKQGFDFQISITSRADGSPLAAYIRLRPGRSVRTEEIEPDVLMADYDEFSHLLGLEILAPVNVNVLINAVPDASLRTSFKAFVRKSVPGGLLKTAA